MRHLREDRSTGWYNDNTQGRGEMTQSTGMEVAALILIFGAASLASMAVYLAARSRDRD